MKTSERTKSEPGFPLQWQYEWPRESGWTILHALERADSRRRSEADRAWWRAWRNGVWVALSAALIPGVFTVIWLWVQ